MNGKKRFIALFLVLVISLTVLSACGNNESTTKSPETSTTESSGTKGNVMIYASIYPDIIEQVDPILKEQFPDINIEWFQGGTEKIVAKLAAEIDANKVQADLIMLADPSYYIKLKEQGLLHAHESGATEEIVRKDPEGYWYAVRQLNMIIAYNEDNYSLEEVPNSFADFADPKYKGMLGMPNPLLSGTALVAVAGLSEKYGWEYFEQLAENDVVVDEGNSAVQNKLLTGEYVAAMILEENILKLRETKQEPLKVIYPEDGVVGIPSAIAMFESSEDKEAAAEVMEWWLSMDGQKAIVDSWMHSVRSDYPNPPFEALPMSEIEKNLIEVDWDELAHEGENVKEQFRKIMLEK